MISKSNQQKISFLIVGLISTATHFSVIYLAYQLRSWSLISATVLGYLTSLLVSYGCNYTITFNSDKKVVTSSLKYVITTLIGLAWNIALMSLLVDAHGVHYIAAFLLMSIVVATNNFLLSKYWVF